MYDYIESPVHVCFLLQVTEELHRVALMQGGFELNAGKRFVLWWNHVVS